MADYFLSDVHLRLDRPDRGKRLAQFIDQLADADQVLVVGDLCDFWFASRQWRRGATECVGLRSLVAFRARGGRLAVMLGNHDASLGPYYERLFGVPVCPDPSEVRSFGKRIWMAHGHRVGATARWKTFLQTTSFARGFGMTPGPLALGLERLLDRTNESRRAESDRRHLTAFRRCASQFASAGDIFVFGHIHRTLDDREHLPRLVVLGDWLEGFSYLKVDDAGVELIVGKERTIS